MVLTKAFNHFFNFSSPADDICLENIYKKGNVMEYFGEGHEIFRSAIRRFVTEEISPHVDVWESQGEIPRDLFHKLGDLGFLGIEYPEKYGGAGADFRMTVVLAEELARCRAGGVAFSVIVHTDMSSPWLARLGTEEQKARYLPDIIKGEKICALSITEPDAGSDMAGIMTTARTVSYTHLRAHET